MGGEVLHRLTSGPGNAIITCLVRDAGKADRIRESSPRVHVLMGDLDDGEMIRRQAAASDVVLSV